MDIQTKRIKLIEWILNLKEEALDKLNEMKEDTLNNTVAYSTSGKPFTKKQYIKHINNIRDSVKNGAKTYSTEEIRKYVLNRKR